MLTNGRNIVIYLLITTLYGSAIAPAAPRAVLTIGTFRDDTGSTPVAAQPGAIAETGLHIVVVSGDNATNNLRGKITVKPVLEIRDGNEKPVQGALVQFTAPVDGPGVLFANGERRASAITDAAGRAAPEEVTAVNAGPFEYKVRAMYHEQVATTEFAQTNLQAASSQSGASGAAPVKPKIPRWVLVALIGGAVAGVGAGLAAGGHQSAKAATPSQTATVSPGGTGTAGPP